MFGTQRLVAALLGTVVLGGTWMAGTYGGEPARAGGALRQAARQAMQEGHFKDAYEAFRKLALDPQDDPLQVGADLDAAIHCLQRLNRTNEIDDFREAVIAVHKGNWRLLWAAARSYMRVPHHGFLIAGQFQRGPHRGGGQVVNAAERDRVRALQLMVQAMPGAAQHPNRAEAADFYLELARILLNDRGHQEAWRLQVLTDLATLPDYEPGWGYYRGEPRGAPVEEDGTPVYHRVPKSWAEATTDGQRWRWCLAQAAEADPSRLAAVRMELADFFRSQFGVETLAYYGWHFGRLATDDTKDAGGTYALHTLKETETIARLATGVRRFELPDEFNFIRIYQQVAEEEQGPNRLEALVRLAEVFENRRQYPRAAQYWRAAMAAAPDARRKQAYRDRLEQITGNWGRFEPAATQPAGRGAMLEFRFRNGKQVEFIAEEIDLARLLDDVKAYIKSRPRQLDWERVNIENLGWRLIQRNQRQYLRGQVAAWKLDLAPRENHFDRRITVTTPLQKAGAYLVTANMAGGNTTHIVVWVADTAIAKKPLDNKTWYFVADAATGTPVVKANLEFFGWKQEHRAPNRIEVLTKEFAEFTDAQGQVILDARQQPADYQWLAIARTADGRLAYLGFRGVWYGERHDPEYNAVKVFTITDRPVYRPGQTVHYKFWVRHAKYDQPDTSPFAGATFKVLVHNPKGEKILETPVQADAFGGVEGKYEIPADAMLGQYALAIEAYGGSSFRVEEYKKPEYEVTIEAPQEPVMLGEKVLATIQARYYFGSPVTHAKVKYKVTRTDLSERWYPWAPWDWLYGPGYWWFAYDMPWYPGWVEWGWRRPLPFWFPRAARPPEVVADRETEIGPDGTVKVEIDTALAKALYPDRDHQYTITAEVVDQSRRTIVGTGSVLVARKPFQVTAWVDRGYYREGDTIHAHFAARTLDGKPVEGKGKLTLYWITYREGQPHEKPVFTLDLPTNAEGFAHQPITAAKAGQYRLAYQLADAKGHTVEGGYVFTIIGQSFRSEEFRYNALELIPDQREYRPGEKVRLLINRDRPGGTVLLFVRPAGLYLPPIPLRLEGKSTVAEIEVVPRDMPNFFVEALTIADGRVHTELKEIIVPPEKRVLNVEVLPSAKEYRPGQNAAVKLKLTDFHGRPFVGSTVVAIYDKSVEYISGGTNVPEIKAFFWKWRRHHHPQTESSLARFSGGIVPPKARPMADIGLFGATSADDLDTLEQAQELRRRGAGPGFGGADRKGDVFGAPLKSGMLQRAAVPAAAAPPAPEGAPMARQLAANAVQEKDTGAAPEAQLLQPTIRKQFADTALWVGALETAPDGSAEVRLAMPENLTTWRIKVWAMGHGTKVGEGATDVVTRKDLIVRLQAPRFFVQKDEVVLSANVHNYLKSEKTVQVALELEGQTLKALEPLVRTVKVAANDEARVDWRVQVLDEGQATVRMKALTDEESDAMEQTFPCYVHGMLKMEAYSGVIPPDRDTGRFTVHVPKERRPPQTRLEVRFSPTLAGAMVDALPYLVDYPYGCTEQTLNRFLPTVITQKVLLGMGLNLKDIQQKRTNLNAQEIGDDAQRARQWKRFDRNPVFDEDELRRMVKEGVARLTEMQLSDGGWGWFSGFGEYPSAHTTALVVHGLQIAQQNDVALVPGVLERGIAWLQRYQDQQVQLLKNAAIKEKPPELRWKPAADNLDAFVYMVLVDAGIKNAEMHEFLYRDRTQLSVYALAMYGLALEQLGDQPKLQMILRNIGQYLQQDDENQTAWLNLPESNWWWCWYGSEFEAHAYYLKLLARTDPKGETARRLVKYLLNNRKHATYWNSTRDTAIVIEAFADFLRASGEAKPEMTVEVLYDGKPQKAVEITPANLFTFDNKFVLEGPAVTDGPHTIELRKKGHGPLYYNGYLTNFTLEDPIGRAGLEIQVQRKYYRLVKVDKTIKAPGSRGQAVGQKVEKFERQPLENLAELQSGQLVEIELEIQSKNDYEYLVFEDMKPAGFEPVDLRSGYNGNPLGAYMEFRDNRVVFFVSRLARGNHSVAYRMRAEIPGRFSALPTKAWAMYAPELKANSDEIKLQVRD